MYEPNLRSLKRTLIRGGVAPVFVTRTLEELGDHYEDLEDEALRAGSSREEAGTDARGRLGQPSAIAAEVLRRPELKTWTFRWPWVRVVLHRFAVLLALSTAPAMAVVGRGASITRWCVSTGLAVLLTGSLLLLMQHMISVGLPA